MFKDAVSPTIRLETVEAEAVAHVTPPLPGKLKKLPHHDFHIVDDRWLLRHLDVDLGKVMDRVSGWLKAYKFQASQVVFSPDFGTISPVD